MADYLQCIFVDHLLVPGDMEYLLKTKAFDSSQSTAKPWWLLNSFNMNCIKKRKPCQFNDNLVKFGGTLLYIASSSRTWWHLGDLENQANKLTSLENLVATKELDLLHNPIPNLYGW